MLKPRRKSPEHDIQAAFVTWCRLNEKLLPALKLAFAVPNGGHRHVATAARLKAEGVRAGVPDWCLPVARGPYIGLWIEMKSGKNKPSDAQVEYIAMLRDARHQVFVCNDWLDAANFVKMYLAL